MLCTVGLDLPWSSYASSSASSFAFLLLFGVRRVYACVRYLFQHHAPIHHALIGGCEWRHKQCIFVIGTFYVD